MKNKELVISVSGKTNTGKSRLTLLLKKFLRENGFEVKFDGGQDFEDEVEFDEQISKNLEQVIETIKETSVVTLKEEQQGYNQEKVFEMERFRAIDFAKWFADFNGLTRDEKRVSKERLDNLYEQYLKTLGGTI